MQKKTHSFIRGAAILAVAGLAAKILGFIPRIMLPRIMGDEGVGLYQMAFPILGLMITLTTAGIPIAISKLVSEASVKNDHKRVRHILIISLFIVGILSAIFTPLMFFLAPFIADVLFTDERAYYALIGITPIVPLIGISAVLRGYFQGKQNMRPSAVYQVVESAVRVGSITFFASWLLPYGVEFAACGAMIGVVVGELAGMLYLFWQFRRVKLAGLFPQRKNNAELKREREKVPYKGVLNAIARIAIPVTASRLISTISMVIEPMLVAHSLALAGFAVAATTAMYGRYSGMAIPILFFPFFITYSLYLSLVPAVSEATAKKDMKKIHYRLNQAIKLSLVAGIPAVVLLYFLANPITTLLYDRPEVGVLLQIMAPFSLFLYLQAPLAAVLQGMDRAKETMNNSIIAIAVKMILIFVLASQPAFGIKGVAISTNAAFFLATALHYVTIVKLTGFKFPFALLSRVSGVLLLLSLFTAFIYNHAWLDSPIYIRLILTTVFSSIVYLYSASLIGLIAKRDVHRIPMFGPALSKVLIFTKS